MDPAREDSTYPRNGVRAAVIAGVALLVMMAASLGMYLPTRAHLDSAVVLGDSDNPDRVNIIMWITRVDTTARTLSVSISDIAPAGSLADVNGFFRDDAQLRSHTSLLNLSTPISKGDDIPDVEQRFALDGTETDYPFDRYATEVQISMSGADGASLPVAITVFSTDPFFRTAPGFSVDDSPGVDFTLALRRSTPTIVYALFVIVLMLGLAAAAATAAYYVLKHRKGLLFPACSMMAAMLFALVPLRNAVPGSPPIGSVIDFASFFIAEVIIATSLIATVILGYRHQMVHERTGVY